MAVLLKTIKMWWKRKVSIEDLKSQLDEAVFQYFSQLGFEKDSENLIYKRNTKFGFEIFELEYLILSQEIKIGFGLRFNEIEDIYDQIQNIESPKNSFTLYIDAFQLLYFKDPNSAKFKFNEINDVSVGLKNSKMIFENYAIEYYQRYNSIKKYSNLVNREKYQEELRGNILFHGGKEDAAINGLIASKLLNENDVVQLQKKHISQNESSRDLELILNSVCEYFEHRKEKKLSR